VWHIWGRRGTRTGFWWENLKKDYLEDLGLDGRIISEWIFNPENGRVWTLLIWIGIGIGGELSKKLK
jgi:hypothetical protein